MSWLSDLLNRFTGKSTPAPAATARKEGDIYVLQFNGLLCKATMDALQGLGIKQMAKGATDMKILLVLNDFRGWKRGDDWGDLNFFATYGQNIAKLAIVGDARWEQDMLMFSAAGHRRGEVQYFTPERQADARAWLSA